MEPLRDYSGKLEQMVALLKLTERRTANALRGCGWMEDVDE